MCSRGANAGVTWTLRVSVHQGVKRWARAGPTRGWPVRMPSIGPRRCARQGTRGTVTCATQGERRPSLHGWPTTRVRGPRGGACACRLSAPTKALGATAAAAQHAKPVCPLCCPHTTRQVTLCYPFHAYMAHLAAAHAARRRARAQSGRGGWGRRGGAGLPPSGRTCIASNNRAAGSVRASFLQS